MAAPSKSRESPEQQSLRLHMKPVGSRSPPAPPPKRPPPLSPGPSLAQTALCPPSPRAPAQQLLCLPGGQEGKRLPAGAQPPQGALCPPTGLLAAHSLCFQPNLVTLFPAPESSPWGLLALGSLPGSWKLLIPGPRLADGEPPGLQASLPVRGIRWRGGRKPGSCQQVPERYQSHLLGLFTLGSAAPSPTAPGGWLPATAGQGWGTPLTALK